MNLDEMINKLNLSIKCGDNKLNQEITGGYVGDLLSDVIANSKAGNIWITMQTHVNIVAVAVLKELSAIIIVQKREPAEDTIKKAIDENVVILSTDQTSFDLVGKLYELGIKYSS